MQLRGGPPLGTQSGNMPQLSSQCSTGRRRKAMVNEDDPILKLLKFTKNCILLQKIAFLAFFENCKIGNGFLSNYFPISNNLLSKLLHKTIGEKLLKNSIFNFAVDK